MMVVCDGLFWFWDVVLGKKEEVGGWKDQRFMFR